MCADWLCSSSSCADWHCSRWVCADWHCWRSVCVQSDTVQAQCVQTDRVFLLKSYILCPSEEKWKKIFHEKWLTFFINVFYSIIEILFNSQTNEPCHVEIIAKIYLDNRSVYQNTHVPSVTSLRKIPFCFSYKNVSSLFLVKNQWFITCSSYFNAVYIRVYHTYLNNKQYNDVPSFKSTPSRI